MDGCVENVSRMHRLSAEEAFLILKEKEKQKQSKSKARISYRKIIGRENVTVQLWVYCSPRPKQNVKRNTAPLHATMHCS